MLYGQMFSDADILSEEFPDDVSVSALCDCGRHKRLHAKTKLRLPVAPLGYSDYKSTFKKIDNPCPRSSKRPTPTPLDLNAPPMTFVTNQRMDFKTYGDVERVKAIVHEEHYKVPSVPMDGTTHYSQEFVPKQPVHEIYSINQHDKLHIPALPLDACTTTKETFKPWQRQPTLIFGELPSFTGSIIFPGRKSLPESTMRHSYQGTFAPPVATIKTETPNIKLEGSMEFETTHRDTYKEIKGDYRAKPVVHKDKASVGKRGKFSDETQFKHDFPGFGSKQPLPPKPAEPAPTTIDLKFNNMQSFSTENRTIFKGHDVTVHPASHSCKVTDEKYKCPSVKFETETSHKRDYRPVNVTTLQANTICVPTGTMALAQDTFFDGHTTNSEFFKNWHPPRRIRFGDFHENKPFIRHLPFQGQSVTHATFTPKEIQHMAAFKPVERTVSSGKVDYTTSYKEEYQKKELRMCRAQIYLLQQEMRRQREKPSAHAPEQVAIK
ncbi:uncharacterized protein LOC112567734 isoform X2 [Pomacea canaliculata]|uniref:uncharacterized protein LOC112567734 isoform X2 n=1 Tax=Pomacea canaliculata TaxID=400727 RepID=UPI000D73712B|nr:uncharacterized protein LOC112567734 isoform X2 [Pomacea canaliculata]